jgi:tRNA-modifying protein YgfZ
MIRSVADLAEPPAAFLAPLEVGAVRVRGQDRTSFLNNVLSQQVTGLGPGTVVSALHLDAKGSPLAVTDVAVLADRVVLLLPTPAVAEEVAASLGSRTFLADALLEAVPVTGRALRGETADEVAAALGADDLVKPADGDPSACLVRERDRCLLVGRLGGLDLVGSEWEVARLAAVLEDAGATRLAAGGLEAWRVAHGVPSWDREIRPPHLPEEAGLLPTHVHLAKGCYPGQEAVARMWMLGRPRRRLAQVILDGDISEGWTTGSGRRSVEVTSAATYAGEPVGLAYVPADAQEGDRFDGDGGSVVVRRFVGEGLAVPGRDPNVQRRRDRR